MLSAVKGTFVAMAVAIGTVATAATDIAAAPATMAAPADGTRTLPSLRAESSSGPVCQVDDDPEHRCRAHRHHREHPPGNDVLDDSNMSENPPRDPVGVVHAERQCERDQPERAEEPQPPVSSPHDESHAQDGEHADPEVLVAGERRSLVAGEQVHRRRCDVAEMPDVARFYPPGPRPPTRELRRPHQARQVCRAAEREPERVSEKHHGNSRGRMQFREGREGPFG